MAGAKTIVCFGDSNTHGYNNKNGKRFSEHVRWPMVLQDLLGEEYLVREEGLSGLPRSLKIPCTKDFPA